VTLLVDTSVWSLAFRRDSDSTIPQVAALQAALNGGEAIVTTGLILQELLQGFSGPRARKDLVQRFAALPLLAPDRRDYIDAADLRNHCRRSGVQLGTIDALLAQLCIRHDLTLLTTDRDFSMAAEHCSLKIWRPLGA
jgi:predicted nucleic acid-binding protein